MGAWTQTKVLVAAVVFSVVACTTLHAQQSLQKFNGSSGLGSTVSIASLRIPEKAWQHFAKAKVLAAHNRNVESEAESRKAIAIAPDFANAYLLCASAQVQEHRFEAAMLNISKAHQIEPNAMWTGVLLASALNGLHRYDEAKAILDVISGSEAQSWQVAYEHARAEIGLVNVGAALHWSDTAIATAPQAFTDVYLLRANALMLAHRWAEATAQMQAFLQTNGASGHRAQVLSALEHVERQAHDEDLAKIAAK